MVRSSGMTLKTVLTDELQPFFLLLSFPVNVVSSLVGWIRKLLKFPHVWFKFLAVSDAKKIEWDVNFSANVRAT